MVKLTDSDIRYEPGPDVLLDKITEEFYQDPLENFSKMFILDIDTVPEVYKSRYIALYNFFRSYNRSLIVGGSVWMKKTNKRYDFNRLKIIAREANPGISPVDFVPDIDIFTSETPLGLKMIFQYDLISYLMERYLKNHSKVFQESKYFKEDKTTGLLGLTDNFDSGLKESKLKGVQNNMNTLYEEGSFTADLFSMDVFMFQALFFKLNIITTRVNTSYEFYSFTQNEIGHIQEASHILKVILDFDFFGAGLVYNPKTRNISHVNALFLKGFMHFKKIKNLDSLDMFSDTLDKNNTDFISIYNFELMNKLIKSPDLNSSLSTPMIIESYQVKDIFSSLRTQPLAKDKKLIMELIKLYNEFNYNKVTLSYTTMKRIINVSRLVTQVKNIFKKEEKLLNDPEFKDLVEEIIHKKINNLLNQTPDNKILRRLPRVLKYRLAKYLNRGYEFEDTNGIISLIKAFEKILNWAPKKIKRLEVKETLNKEYGVSVLKEIDDIFNRL